MSISPPTVFKPSRAGSPNRSCNVVRLVMLRRPPLADAFVASCDRMFCKLNINGGKKCLEMLRVYVKCDVSPLFGGFFLASFKGQSMLKRVVQLMFSISIGFSASWVDHINDNSALARQPLFQRCQEIALWVFRSCQEIAN